jgi:hypothetical protein
MPRLACTLLLVLGIATVAQAQLPDPVKAREKELKASVKTFQLELRYNGPEDKPFYRLTLDVLPSGRNRNNPFYRFAQISEAEAKRVIDQLAADGFLTDASDLANDKVPIFRPPNKPGYTLTVTGLYQDLGWGLPMLKRLDGLRKVLDGDAAKEMDLLLGRLSGFRRPWTKEVVAKPKVGQ